MVCCKVGVLGLNHSPTIDDGTLSRSCSPCPGIDIFDITKQDFVDLYLDLKKKVEQRNKQLRDSIIDYHVDKRIEKLGNYRGHRIRYKEDGEIKFQSIKHRPLSKIDSLVLHQTGRDTGNAAERYYAISVHFIIVPNGTILQIHSESVKCYASGQLNNSSVAVEFVGNFKQHNNVWRLDGAKLNSGKTPTKAQIYSGRKLISYLKKTLGIKYVYAHSQTKKMKGNCPGPEIWFNVGEWALKNGLSEGGPNFKVSTGLPIAKQWRDEKFDLLNMHDNALMTPDF